MEMRFLLCMLGCLALITPEAAAQFWGAKEPVAEEVAPLAKPISLLDEVKDTQENNVAETVEVAAIDPDVSYYVQNLNLSAEQLSEIQKISANTVAAQEEIMQKIEALRQEIRSLEVSSIVAFEGVLDDSQKAEFRELRAGYEAAQGGHVAAKEAETAAESVNISAE